MTVQPGAESYSAQLKATRRGRRKRINGLIHGMRRFLDELEDLRPAASDDVLDEDDDSGDLEGDNERGSADQDDEVDGGAEDEAQEREEYGEEGDGEEDFDFEAISRLQAKLDARGFGDAFELFEADAKGAQEEKAFRTAFEAAEMKADEDSGDECCDLVAEALVALRALLSVWEVPMERFEELLDQLSS